MPAEPAASPVRVRTKADHVYETLREGILHLRLPPDSPLRIDILARTYGMSPIPIREALARLMTERFVCNRPYVGTHVASIDASAVHDVFSLLAGLESGAATRVAEAVSDGDVAALEEAVAAMEPEARLTGEEWTAANKVFHLRLVAVAGLPLVEESLRLGFAHWERIRRRFFGDLDVRRQWVAQEEHHSIVNYARARDGARLEKSLRIHNESALRAYLALLEP